MNCASFITHLFVHNLMPKAAVALFIFLAVRCHLSPLIVKKTKCDKLNVILQVLDFTDFVIILFKNS